MKLGVIAAPMNFRLTETDLRAILANAGVRIVVTQGEFADLVRPLGSELGFGVLLADGAGYRQAAGAGSAEPPASLATTAGSADALIQYTSGTTGRPKGATLTHDAVLMHAANVALEYAIDSSSRVLISIPHNSATNIQTIPALYTGATLVLGDVRSFDGEAWLERANRLGVTHSQVVPTMLYRVLEVARRSGQSSYGIDVRVKGPAGELLDVSGRGEVVFKGPYVMRGYWNEPELTAAAIQDGWMHSGDVAELRDGWFYLVDRIKDIIIRGGQKQQLRSRYVTPALCDTSGT